MNTENINRMSRQIFQILSRSSKETLTSLDTLSAGDILKGRIQSIENGILLIKLPDGAVFTAKAPEGFKAEPGEFITLMIGEKLNEQITAKIVSESQTIKPNEQNTLIIDIRNVLDALGVINPERMTSKVMDLIKADPGMPLDKAAFLAANNLSDHPELSEIIHKISEHEFSLHENLKSLENGIMNALSKMDPKEGTALLQPLLVKQTLEELAAELKNNFPDDYSRLAESVSEKINEILIKTFMEEISGREGINVANTITKDFLEIIMNEGNLLNMTDGKIHSQNAEDTDLNAESLFKATEGRFEGLRYDETENILKTIDRALEKYFEKASRLQKGGEEALKEMKEAIERIFEKASIKADDGAVEKFDIKEKSQTLKDIMELAQKAMKQMDGGDRDFRMPSFREIDNAFRFFTQITTYDSILQLPLRINEEETTGELYIMKRKKGRKKIDIENFTLFISLKTESLGLIESYLNAAKKRVTISFRVENEDLARLVRDNHKALYDGLYEKGFILVEMKCRVMDSERSNLFNAGSRARELFGTGTRVDIRL